MQRQARLSQQRQQAAIRQHNQAVRQHAAAVRQYEAQQRRAAAASEQERKRLEKEAAQAYLAARQAEVEDRNLDLQDQYAVLDGLLADTLEVDDYVDLESLRAKAEHPPFEHEHLRVAIPAPTPIPDPPLPVKQAPAPVKGLFGRKEKEAAAIAAAEQQYATDYYAWQAATAELPAQRAAQQAEHEAAEQSRQRALAEAKTQYEQACEAREQEAAAQNAELDELIAGLAYGTEDAVQEYVSIVLANSVYPDGFEVSHTATFDPATAELAMKVVIPGPDVVPTVKSYKYTRASDEITGVAATQKDTRDRYAGVVNAVTLRSLHEVFEADRRGLIKSISLELGTETVSPATGQHTYVPFVAVAASREVFEQIDLSAVVPALTLEHLGAAVSKNPHALTPISTAGVRKAR